MSITCKQKINEDILIKITAVINFLKANENVHRDFLFSAGSIHKYMVEVLGSLTENINDVYFEHEDRNARLFM